MGMLLYSHGGFCCPLPINSRGRKRKGVFYSKAIQFWKNNVLLPQSPFPLKYPKTNNSSILCQIRLRLRLEFLLPFKNTAVLDMRLSWFLAMLRLQASFWSLSAPAYHSRCTALSSSRCPSAQRLHPVPPATGSLVCPCAWRSRAAQCQSPALPPLLVLEWVRTCYQTVRSPGPTGLGTLGSLTPTRLVRGRKKVTSFYMPSV